MVGCAPLCHDGTMLPAANSQRCSKLLLYCCTVLGVVMLVSDQRLFKIITSSAAFESLRTKARKPSWSEATVAANATNTTNNASTEAEDLLPQVACVIYTYHGNRELITESYETWGNQCQDFDAFSDEEWEYAPGKVTVPLRAYPAPKEQLIGDVRKIWHYLGDRYDSKTLHADFVTFSGDDAFWIMPSLRNYLNTFTSAGGDTWLLLGGTDQNLRESNFPWIGGAGYVISRQLIEERVLERCPERSGKDEDFFTSACLYANGVNFTETRDALGKPRFCRDKPGKPCEKPGVAHPSSEVVLFHYTKGAVRQQLAQKYYGNVSEALLEINLGNISANISAS